MTCISCGNIGSTTIKNITFCTTCYSTRTIKKVRQIIKTLPSPAIVINPMGTYLTKKLSMLNTILMHKHNVQVFIPNINGIKALNHQYRVLEGIDTFDYERIVECLSVEYGIGVCDVVVIELAHLDEIAVGSMVLFAEGNGQAAVRHVGRKRMCVRPFERITENELVEFDTGEEMVIEDVLGKEEEEVEYVIIKKFIGRMNQNNYSTSNNVVDILKKIGGKIEK